jgi:transposase-like protein/IS1 family transposase
MDWEMLYCPNQYCRYYGLSFRHSVLVKNGSSHGQKQALCRACGQSVGIRYGTAYCDLNADPAIFDTTIRALAEGNSFRGAARIVQIDKDTVCAWLNRAAQHCRMVMLYLWYDLPVAECQMDELWSFAHTKEQHLEAAKLWCATYGDAWVWIAFAPIWRLIVAFAIGKRIQASANLLLERVKHATTADIPFFTSDQLPEYRTALLHVYGQWQQPARKGTRGAFPKPRLMPPPELLYAQVVKQRERGAVVAVTNKTVFGTDMPALERALAWYRGREKVDLATARQCPSFTAFLTTIEQNGSSAQRALTRIASSAFVRCVLASQQAANALL